MTMIGLDGLRRRTATLAVAGLATAALAPGVAAQTSKLQGPPTSLPASMVDDLVELRDKFVLLAEAMPDSAWSWRPMEGVRSFRDVVELMTVEGGLFPTMWGFEGPEGSAATLPAEYDRLGALSNAEATAEMARALDHMIGIARGLDEREWRRPATFFGRDVDLATAVMYSATDMHEHLGQAIAYARTNRVVPPWSGGG